MSRLLTISDLHLRHKNIHKFCPNRGASSSEEHDAILKDKWHSVVGKHDHVIVCGDVAFSREGIEEFGTWTGTKTLVRGNHDDFADYHYDYFVKKLYSLLNKGGFWWSHAPIHPEELRNKRNIHGHIHQNPLTWNPVVDGKRSYINVCVDACDGYPVDIADIRSGAYEPLY